jgi:hypothetical protein
MATFFIPPLEDGSAGAERTYRDLRDKAEACVGEVSRERRIEGVLCRFSGRDCQLRVGEVDAGNGQTVTAIIQLGRDTYTVHHLATDRDTEIDPLVLRQSDVYMVTEFQ